MSLLYECINGLIQGGILDFDAGIEEKDEIASLCVGKLRGMVVSDSDPNRERSFYNTNIRIIEPEERLTEKHKSNMWRSWPSTRSCSHIQA